MVDKVSILLFVLFFAERKPVVAKWIVCSIFSLSSLLTGVLLISLVVSELFSVFSHWNNDVALVVLVLNHLIAPSLFLSLSVRQDDIAEVFMVDARVFLLYDRVLVPIIVFLLRGRDSTEESDDGCLILGCLFG